MPHQCTECGYTFPDGSKEMLSGCPECGGNKFQYHPGAVPDDPEETDPPDRPSSVSGAVGRAADTVRDVFGGDADTADAPEESPEPGKPSPADEPTESPAKGNPAESPTKDNRTASRAENEPAERSADSPAESGGDTDSWPDPDGAAARNAGTDPAKATNRSDEPSASASSDDTELNPPETEGHEDRAQADARSQVVDETDLPSANDPEQDPKNTPDVSGGNGASHSEPDDEPDTELSDLREELNSQFESIRIVEPGQYELNLMELYDRDQYIIALQEDGRYVIEVPEAWREE